MARQTTTRHRSVPSRQGLRLALAHALARKRHAELAPFADDARLDRKAERLVLMFRSLRDVLRARPNDGTDAVA